MYSVQTQVCTSTKALFFNSVSYELTERVNIHNVSEISTITQYTTATTNTSASKFRLRIREQNSSKEEILPVYLIRYW